VGRDSEVGMTGSGVRALITTTFLIFSNGVSRPSFGRDQQGPSADGHCGIRRKAVTARPAIRYHGVRDGARVDRQAGG
jgi:hypothetical protein